MQNIFFYVYLTLSLYPFHSPPPLQVLLPHLLSSSDVAVAAGTSVSRRLGMLLLQHPEVLPAHPLLAAQVQAEVASDGSARRPHSRADGCTSGAGLC